MAQRRAVVQGLGGLMLGALLPRARAAEHCVAGPGPRFCFEAAPFPLGVASGDPSSRSVILWTRLAADPLAADGQGGLTGDLRVEWLVASDPGLRHVVASGRTVAGAAAGYAVHVTVPRLRPATHYWYRFASGGQVSRIGRTRTAPAAGVAAVRFAAVSCQDFVAEYGAYAALAHEALDCVVHLGDSIYERALDGVPATSLADYRRKHALFRGDPRAREAWAAHPFCVTWDDHEVHADYWGTDRTLDARRGAAYRAYYEHMPLRLPAGPPADWRDLRIFRHLRFGDLLELVLLDLRQYRDAPPRAAPQAAAAGRTLLGASQKQWLLERLLRSSARWQGIASSVLMTDHYGNADAWDGYAHERREVLQRVRAGRTVVVAGDWHRATVSRLMSGGTGPGFAGARDFAALEFGVPALSSPGPGPERADPDRGFAPAPQAPWVLYEDTGYRGYLVCDVTPDSWRGTFRVLQDGRSRRLTTLASFTLGAGGAVTSSGFVPF